MSRLLLVLAGLSLSACFWPHELDPIIATQGGKHRLLSVQVEKFHKSLNWGDFASASELVAPDALDSFSETTLGDAFTHRIIDIKVDKTQFSKTEDDTAYIETSIRYYRVPAMTVETTGAKETWKFSRFSGGWLFVAAEKRSGSLNPDTSPIGGFLR